LTHLQKPIMHESDYSFLFPEMHSFVMLKNELSEHMVISLLSVPSVSSGCVNCGSSLDHHMLFLCIWVGSFVVDCVFVSLSINTQLFDYEPPATYCYNAVAGARGSPDCRWWCGSAV